MLAIIVTMGAVIYVLAKSNKANKKELVQTQARLESARANVQQLSEYVDKLLKIKSDEKSISQKIKEAKSDEEIFNIIADVVGANNNRVQNNESN
jgi:hypothetical protein